MDCIAHFRRLLTALFVLAFVVSPVGAQKPGDAARDESIVMGAMYPSISGDGQTVVFSYQGAIWRTPHGQWLDARDGTPKLVVTDRANKRLQ
jgi:hypothetical protein